MVKEKRVTVLGFVIMPNHVHIIWQIQDGHERKKVQQSFLRYTAQQIKFDLERTNASLLEEFRVDAADREYQFWERNALSVDLFTDVVFEQKLEYIHNNPIQEKWKMALYAEDYRWSSAGFYAGRKNEFEWLTACDDV